MEQQNNRFEVEYTTHLGGRFKASGDNLPDFILEVNSLVLRINENESKVIDRESFFAFWKVLADATPAIFCILVVIGLIVYGFSFTQSQSYQQKLEFRSR